MELSDMDVESTQIGSNGAGATGNTNTVAPSNMRCNPAKNWCFTYNNYDFDPFLGKMAFDPMVCSMGSNIRGLGPSARFARWASIYKIC